MTGVLPFLFFAPSWSPACSARDAPQLFQRFRFRTLSAAAADVNPIAAVVKQVAQYLRAPVPARDVGELLPAEVASKSISFCTVRNLQTP